jgi:glycosyltransferase involved in cell wall biosynthesis
MEKKLLIICPYPENCAPSQRLKYEQYFDAFRNDGWDITVRPFIDLRFWKIIYKKGNVSLKFWYTLIAYLKRFFLLFSIPRYHIVYIHLWGTPFGPPVYERLLRVFSKRLVYDIDDLVYLADTKSQAHPLVQWIKGRGKPLYLMKHAAHVITCTPYLDQFVRKYNDHTTDISSTVDTEQRYKAINTYKNDHTIIIGWSGSVTTTKYFYLLEEIFKKLKEIHDFKVIVMGDETVSMPNIEIEALSWNENYEIATLQKFDIGVYPLPNEEWVYGKSGLKAIQYMALGIPTVATAIGANFRVIENGVSGFLVHSEEEWLDALSRLIKDSQLRKKVGLAARQRVVELFSVKANIKKYLSVLNTN